MKYYHYPLKTNIGDTLTPYILKHFLPDIPFESVSEKEEGKLLVVGSIMSKIKKGDIVWGTGCQIDKEIKAPPNTLFLAVRGMLTKKLIKGAFVPEVYGDPALLLSVMYYPKVEKKYKIGIIPHYVDKKLVQRGKIIDVALPWKEFVNEILSCEEIISSSLHGIIIAESYGIPASWIKYSDKVRGKGFKFYDYLSGTDRKIMGFNVLNKAISFPPLSDLSKIQHRLLDALEEIRNLI